MSDVTRCPSCQAKLRLPLDSDPKKIRCPKCKTVFHPEDNSPTPAPAKVASAAATTRSAGLVVSLPPTPLPPPATPGSAATRASRSRLFVPLVIAGVLSVTAFVGMTWYVLAGDKTATAVAMNDPKPSTSERAPEKKTAKTSSSGKSVDHVDVGPLFRAYGWDTKPGSPAHKLLSQVQTQKTGHVDLIGSEIMMEVGTADTADLISLFDSLPLNLPNLVSESMIRELLDEPQARDNRDISTSRGSETYESWSYAGGALEILFPKPRNGKERHVKGNRFNRQFADRLYIGDSRDPESQPKRPKKRKD